MEQVTENTETPVVDKAAERAAQKAIRDAEKAEVARIRAEKREAEKAAKAEARLLEQTQRREAKKAAELLRTEEREKQKALREANRPPVKNGIRRPKPETLCGQAWAIFDRISNERGSPASIGESMPYALEAGLNESNVRAEYARWRRFYGVTGRIKNPLVEEKAVGADVTPE